MDAPADRIEGADTASAERDSLAARARVGFGIVPGVLVAAALAYLATLLDGPLPLLGGPVIALVLGVLASGPASRARVLEPGVRFSARIVLQVAVVVLGTQLSLRRVTDVGRTSLPIMLVTLVVCLASGYVVGRAMKVDTDLRILIGVGTGICGASAIATVSTVIRPRSATVAYAISTIFLFNLAAVVTFPHIGYLLHMNQHNFGLFAGTAINDTSSVVAAATIYGASAANYAVVVKLARTLMIIPICVGLAGIIRRRERNERNKPRSAHAALTTVRLIPWFLIGFLLAAAANSAGWVSATAGRDFHVISGFLIIVALSAVGLSTNVTGIRRAGVRPLLLGLVLWLVVTGSSLGLQALTR